MKVHNTVTLPTDRIDFHLNYCLLKFTSSSTENSFQAKMKTCLKYKRLKPVLALYSVFQMALYCIYLASYLKFYDRSHNGKSLVFQLVLIGFLIFINLCFMVFGLCFSILKSHRNQVIELNYFVSCVFIIFNSQAFQSQVFEVNSESLSSLPGILALVVLNMNFVKMNFKRLVCFNSLIAALYAIVSLNDKQESLVVFEVLILIFIMLFQVLYCYIIELSHRKKFVLSHMEHNQELAKFKEYLENQNRNLSLSECIEELSNLTQFISNNLKIIVESIITSLQSVRDNLRLEESPLENLSHGLDEEDKLYIQQSCLPHKISDPVKQKKFKQRKSLESIIEKVLSQDAIILLKQISNNWNIDMFSFNEKTDSLPITVLGRYCMKLYNLTEVYQIPEIKLTFFFNEIQKQYKFNPYHNAIHAADVLSSGLYLINNSEIVNSLSNLEILSVIISHLAHDVGHPGLNNRFLINFSDPLAIQYNDISVLENMHCSVTFTIMQDKDKNILNSLSQIEYQTTRKLIIEMILVTDMSKHFDLIGHFKAKGYKIKDLENKECKLETLKMIIHSADIAHSSKVTHLHMKWSKLLAEEFYHQGDVEKEMGQAVSMYCDRETTILSKSQIGFLKNIALPLFEIVAVFLDNKMIWHNVLEQLKININAWEFEYNSCKMQTMRMDAKNKFLSEVYSPTGIVAHKSMVFSNLS